ncbi:MAG: helix-turn-helix domain-containing protein, partial [Chitinophagaceae bacterium]
IFFVHGLVYAFLLWYKGNVNEQIADKWLGLFLFFSVLYICPWMLGFAGWYDALPYRDILFYTPFQQLFFMGPMVFFYVQSLLNPSFQFTKKQAIHLLPGCLYLFYSIIVFVTDKWVLKQYFFYSDGIDKDFDLWYQIAGYVSMILYFIASIRYYNAYTKLLQQVVSNADTMLFKWVRNFLVAFLLILLLRIFFFILSIFIDIDYGGNWWGYFVFSILFYYIAVSGYANRIITKHNFITDIITQKTLLLLPANNGVNDIETTYEEIPIIEVNDTVLEADIDWINDWKEKLITAVVVNQLYKNPELSLPDLAKKMHTNASVLSKAINNGFSMSFNDFINYHRVQMVIEMLQQGEHKKQTLLGIAFDCGFNSKATFNRAFKKVTQVSPKEWLQINS